MRLSSIFILMLLFSKLHSQCLVNAINSTFVNNIAVLGHDSVVVTMTHFADITLSSGGSKFQLSINGVIQSGGNGIANVGDIVKIKPIAVGMETINVDGDCSGTFWGEINTVVSSPLPVTWLSSPSATIKNNQTHISWSVASQVNNSHFIIEHSSDGRSYSEIGKVHSQGNTSETKHYTYIHEIPSIGINYYRIKQVDYDGKYSYSDIASVRYDDHGETIIYPNPVSDVLTIESVSETNHVRITDISGRIILSQQIISKTSQFDTSTWSSGLYIVTLTNQAGRNESYKVAKQ